MTIPYGADTGFANPSQFTGPSSPAGIMTTLGDIIYENSAPAPARLAGNTAAAKRFLTQTGTGTVSAAPAWGTIATTDLPTGVLLKVADAGNSGVALINGTQTFCSYTTPNDGNLHPVIVMFDLVVSSTQTGGATGLTFTDAGGNVRTNFQILGGAQATGLHLWGFNNFLAAANTSFAVVQVSAQTGGASVAYAQVFAA